MAQRFLIVAVLVVVLFGAAISLAGATRPETSVNGENGDDRLEGGGGTDVLNGGEGDDSLFGELGQDSLRAGAGDDFVYAVDGVAETVDCGPGDDGASVDRSDKTVGCEGL